MEIYLHTAVVSYIKLDIYLFMEMFYFNYKHVLVLNVKGISAPLFFCPHVFKHTNNTTVCCKPTDASWSLRISGGEGPCTQLTGDAPVIAVASFDRKLLAIFQTGLTQDEMSDLSA